jgi:hypothetical protein
MNEQQLIDKIRRLPPDKQQEVLDFVEEIEHQTETGNPKIFEARQSEKTLAEELDEIALHCSRLPVLDNRSPDEILGYDENGLPR